MLVAKYLRPTLGLEILPQTPSGALEVKLRISNFFATQAMVFFYNNIFIVEQETFATGKFRKFLNSRAPELL